MTRPLLPLDFETYYENQGYTLKKLTYIEYVTHELFKIHGVGFKWEGKDYWMTDMDEFQCFLDGIGEDVELLCHNTMFDGYILHHCFNWHPKVYRDTQCMSRGMFVGQSASLDALTKRLFPNDPTKRKGKELINFAGKYDLTPDEEEALGGYCMNDVEIMLADYEAMLPHYPDREMALIDLTLQMYCDPIFEIDVPLTEQTLKEKTKERQQLIEASGVAESTLSSNTKFQEWIEKQGIEPPTKTSPTTGEETFAGGKNDLEFQLMRREHPKFEHVWKGRVAAKSTGEISRAERFLQVARDTGGLLPVPLNYYSAHTGRYGGTQKINLQNLGRKSSLRRAIRAPKGKLVYVADSSNIEARVNNWNAGQADMLQKFRDGVDVYSAFAGDHIYHMPVNKDDNPTERFVGKVAVLGLGYGMGAGKFRETLAVGAMGPQVFIDDQEAFGVVNAYRTAHYMIKRLWATADLMLVKMLDPKCDEEWGVLHVLHNMIVLPNGMALQYPGLRAHEDPRNGSLSFEYWNGKYWKNTWGGTIIENVTQALARIILFEQMLDINDWTKRFDPEGRVCLNVHDEIITVASDFGAVKTDELDEKDNPIWTNDSEAKEFYDGIEAILRTPLDWCPDLPLDCEGGWDYCYSK